MINFFREYIEECTKSEVISIPLYNKKAWKRYAKKSCISFKKYHDLNMLCEYVKNIIDSIDGCNIKYIRFVLIEENMYIKWVRSTHMPTNKFSSHISYIQRFDNATANTLWQKVNKKISHHTGLLLIKDEGGTAPCITDYDFAELSDLVTAILNKERKGLKLSSYPYITPLSYIEIIQDTLKKDAAAFGTSIFAPRFTTINHQEVNPGEECCDDGILYMIPIHISADTTTSILDIETIVSGQYIPLESEKMRTSIENLLRLLNPRFRLADNGIIMMDDLLREAHKTNENIE